MAVFAAHLVSVVLTETGAIKKPQHGWSFDIFREGLSALVQLRIAHAQALTAFLAACAQDLAPTGTAHALSETVLVTLLPVRGLKCHFHSSGFYWVLKIGLQR